MIPKVVERINMIKGMFVQKKFNSALAKTMVRRLDFIKEVMETLSENRIEEQDHIAITNVRVTIEEAQE